MSIVSNGNQVRLPAGQVLTLSSSASAAAGVNILKGGTLYGTTQIGASADVSFGPFSTDCDIEVAPTTGSVDIAIDWAFSSPVTVPVFGADPTGARDSSRAFQRAAASANNAGGGVVVAPPGTYKVAALPLYSGVTYDNRGRTFTTTGADHMFKAVAGAMRGGGILGGRYFGNATNTGSFDGTVDCINMAAATSCDQTTVFSQMYAEKFRNAYYGSLDDRDPRIDNNDFYGNNAGIWVVNNHPYLTGENDIRSNNYGLTGNVLYDMNVTGQKFAYNQYNIAAQSGGSIQNCSFTGCTIAFGVVVGAQLGSGCSVVGGFLLAPSTGTAGIGIEAVGSGGIIVNGVTVQSFGQPFTTGAIVISATSSLHNIVNNSFAASGSSIGKGIVISADCNVSAFSNNKMRIQGATDQLLVKAGTGAFNYNSVVGNGVNGTVASTATIISINASNTTGIIITGNHMFLAGGSSSVGIAAGVASGWAKGNVLRNAGGGYSFTAANANTNGMGVGAVATTDNIAI